MNKTRGLLLTAGFVLATAFTFSCSGDDNSGGGGDPSSSSGGGEPSGGGNACTNLEEVQIGSQKWAKKNLDCDIAGSKCYGEDGQVLEVIELEDGSYTAEPTTLTNAEVQANCTKYGRLYDWNTAKTACPNGWRLPSEDDWLALVSVVGDVYNDNEGVAAKLRARSGWNDWEGGASGNGTDEHGFTALPGGYYNTSNSVFREAGYCGHYWNINESKSNTDYATFFELCIDGVDLDPAPKSNLNSIRCIKD